MERGLCNKSIRKMVKEGKLLREGNKYQFNEHYETWVVCEEKIRCVEKAHTEIENEPVSKTLTNCVENTHLLCEKDTSPVSKTHTLDIPQTMIKKDLEAQIPLRKENIKETNNKETIKKIECALKDKNQNILLKDEKQEKAKELIKEFSRIRNIPLDSGFFSKNIRSARALVSTYPVEYILAGIEWRLANDPDGFWESKLWSLNSVYSHFAEWIAQAKLSTGKTFEDWLAKHPEQSYRGIKEPDAKIKAFFVAFNRALKEGIVPTQDEWKKYQTARELQREGLRR